MKKTSNPRWRKWINPSNKLTKRQKAAVKKL